MNLLHGRQQCTLDANLCRNALTRIERDNARKLLSHCEATSHAARPCLWEA